MEHSLSIFPLYKLLLVSIFTVDADQRRLYGKVATITVYAHLYMHAV